MILRLLKIFCVVSLFTENYALNENGTDGRKFPTQFVFGAATSAYQVEGGWNEDGRGPSIWDVAVHQHPSPIKDGSTGDVAADSYHRYKRDVEIAQEIRLQFYRFSISWSRILPTGFANKINKAGVDYYNNLINELLEKNITPFVTMYHWDLPETMQKLGGWTNPEMVNYFADYAKVLFDKYGNRVKYWTTFNEPKPICYEGYGADWKAPFLNMSGIAEYLCAKNILMAHATVYHLYNESNPLVNNNVSYREMQKGKIGITLSCTWYEPKNSSNLKDREAALYAMQFDWGQYAEPIFGNGDFPLELRLNVQDKSDVYGFPRTRLPILTKKEIKFIKGSADFFGLNGYTTRLASQNNPSISKYPKPSYMDDMGVVIETDPSWPKSQSSWLQEVPWGFTKLLKEIKYRYNNPTVYITENGWSSAGELEDLDRIQYIRSYLNATLDALDYGCNIQGYFVWSLIDNFEWKSGYTSYLNATLDALDYGCNIQGYFVWSLIDNFEWKSGYTEKFGLYQVDFNKTGCPRRPRMSAYIYRDIITRRAIDFTYYPMDYKFYPPK